MAHMPTMARQRIRGRRCSHDLASKPSQGARARLDRVVGATAATHVAQVVVDQHVEFRVAHGPLGEPFASRGSASSAIVHCLALPGLEWESETLDRPALPCPLTGIAKSG